MSALNPFVQFNPEPSPNPDFDSTFVSGANDAEPTYKTFTVAQRNRSIAGRGVVDPVTVFYQDSIGRGRVVVQSGADAWTIYLGSVGEQSLLSFMAKANDDYLGEKLASDAQLSLASQDPDRADNIISYMRDIARAVIDGAAGEIERQKTAAISQERATVPRPRG